MAQEVQFIVEKLKGEPFNKTGLSLVTFDEKVGVELVQLLSDVFAEMDERHRVDLRDEPPETTADRLFGFLRIIKYNVPAEEAEDFKRALMAGDRNVVYPILHHVLSKFPQLQKRAYVARFLVNVAVPDEFMHDEVVADVHQHYKERQEEFIEVHKRVDRLRGNSFNPADLKREITQLEEEKTQLTEKISTLQRKTVGMDGFSDLLEATSSLRREQEEESKLQERMHEQRLALSGAEKRYTDATRRLAEARSNSKQNVSAQQLLDMAQKEARENRELCQKTLPQTLAQRHETLVKLQRLLSDPAKTEDDVRELQNRLRMAERDVERLNNQIAEAQKKAGDDKLAMYRHHSALVSKKLQQKEADLEEAESELNELNREIEGKEAKVSEMAGSKFMGREEFKRYASQLREKTNKFKKLKAELNEIRDETVVLTRTVAILQGKDQDLAAFLAKMESEKGISGYTDTQAKLEKMSKETATLDQTKGKTLEEISNIVTDITQTLKERKNKLAPQIKELRAVRQRYQELEGAFLSQKGKYEHTAVGLETERSRLQKECDALQEECLREESRYHYLNSLSDIADGQLERVREEAKFERGEGRLLRNFKTWRELYQNKVQQQEQLAKQLRKQQKSIKENEGPNMAQRAQFLDLQSLLALKLKLYKELAGQQQKDDAANISAFDTMEIGGANVMTIDQSDYAN